jgi:hypothetical protein
MAKDKFHYTVRRALEKEGWEITHDPLRLEFSEEDRVEVDLGAQQVLAAQRIDEKIAVEIKSFLNDSALLDFHLALGQFLNYRLVLQKMEPDRILYLAVPLNAHKSFFGRDLPRLAVQQYQVKLIVYDEEKEVISAWIN